MKNLNDRIWFQLYNSETGLPFRGLNATYVSLPSSAVIDQFIHAVRIKYTNLLRSVFADDLKVYKNKDSYDKRNLKEEKVT